MAAIDGPWSDWVEFTLDDAPPTGPFTDGPWSPWVVFTIDPDGGWTDGPWSNWVEFTIDAGPGASGLFVVDATDALVELVMYVAAEL